MLLVLAVLYGSPLIFIGPIGEPKLPESYISYECECDGISFVVNVCSVSPPVSFSFLYDPPYPRINLPDKFGVPFLPLHNTQLSGIFVIVPLQAQIMPEGMPAELENASSLPRANALVFPTMNFRT